MIKCPLLVISLVFVLLSIVSCSGEGLVEPHGEVNIQPPISEGLLAVDFPTNNGSAWTYMNVDTDEEFTLRIEGIRDIEGYTYRQMTISEIGPKQPNRINRAAIDHLSANRLYFGEGKRVGRPLFATYFLKTPQSYIESAFDVYILPSREKPERIIHLEHVLPRLIWDFPLKVGKQWTVLEFRKEWTVLEKETPPVSRVVRRVVDANVPVTVPAGWYDAYVVEEVIVGLSQETAFKLAGDPPKLEPARYEEPARYWVAPHVGVVKYQYTYLTPTIVNQKSINLLRSATFKLKKVDLPPANPH